MAVVDAGRPLCQKHVMALGRDWDMPRPLPPLLVLATCRFRVGIRKEWGKQLTS